MSNGQIHNINSMIAGLISQESIKLITSQFYTAV